ncbi:MAG TPA: hypothetical protein RMH99_31240 [Sandaracinaceae bacterium LLY-WYZ-13_1]|nr:hypothetical protein [Sandaracinaceae bacterium LLY-WYZ-13_1]
MRYRLEEGRFGGRPPDLVHEASGFRIWNVDPVGILTQVGDLDIPDVAVAEFLSREGQALVDARLPDGQKASYFHDWTRLRGYSPAARRVMTEWALRVRPRTERIVIALAPQAKVVKMGVSVATMTLQLAGLGLDVGDEIQPYLDEHGVRPA